MSNNNIFVFHSATASFVITFHAALDLVLFSENSLHPIHALTATQSTAMKKAVGKVRDMSLEKNVYKKFTEPKVAMGKTTWPPPNQQETVGIRADSAGERVVKEEVVTKDPVTQEEVVTTEDVTYNDFNIQCNSGNIPSFWQLKRKEVGGTHADVAVMTVKKDGTRDDVDKAWARVYEAMKGGTGTPTGGSAPGGGAPGGGTPGGSAPAGGEGKK
ncbi:MAG: hypothetical protein Q9208_006622 [Pyrenodesmia sp. 3 TL-2023]